MKRRAWSGGFEANIAICSLSFFYDETDRLANLTNKSALIAYSVLGSYWKYSLLNPVDSSTANVYLQTETKLEFYGM